MNEDQIKLFTNNIKEEIGSIKQSKHNIESAVNKILSQNSKKDVLEALLKILFFDTTIINNLDQREIEEIYTKINNFKINTLSLYSHYTSSTDQISEELYNSIIQSSRDILINKYMNPQQNNVKKNNLSKSLLEEEQNQKIQNTLTLIANTLSKYDQYATLINQEIKDESIFKITNTAIEYIMLYRSAIQQKEETTRGFLDIYSGYIKRFKDAMVKFAENRENKELEQHYIESAKNIIKRLNIFANDNVQNNIENTSIPSEEIKILQEKIKKLEIKTDEQNFEAYIKEALQKLNQANLQFEESNKILSMTLEGNGLINNEIKKLIDASEGHTAYHLARELQKKSEEHAKIVQDEKSTFIRSLSLVIILSIGLFTLYFLNEKVNTIDFWKFLSIKFTITAPFIFYAFFCLNEYTKAKRLYEEFDYKRIMAQTLMNNYNRLKGDFTQDQDKLLDLLKTPIEKIFDNPVHSVYGDKSGDKGLGIDQLEKIVSIASKLKDKKD